MTRVSLLACLLIACGARAGLPVEGEADASPDAPSDASLPDASLPDASGLDAPPPPPPPPSCIAEPGFGAIRGGIPGLDIDFPFIVAGVESFGSHSCPRLFIRAGNSPTFDGAYLEIEVPYFGEPGFTPGTRAATLTVYPEGRRTLEPWFEEILVDVERVDGIEPTSTPREAWRAVAAIDYHDATTDLIGIIDEAPYCNDFGICI